MVGWRGSPRAGAIAASGPWAARLADSDWPERCSGPARESHPAHRRVAVARECRTTVRALASEGPSATPRASRSTRPRLARWLLRSSSDGNFRRQKRQIHACGGSLSHLDRCARRSALAEQTMPDALDLLKTRRSLKPVEL